MPDLTPTDDELVNIAVTNNVDRAADLHRAGKVGMNRDDFVKLVADKTKEHADEIRRQRDNRV